jgi:hypothetical protein
MATVAVFLVLGGGVAWALANNSVKSRHIANGQVKTKDLADAGVNSAKLENGSVALADIQGVGGHLWSGLDVGANDCVNLTLFSQSLEADDGVLVVPRRRDGATVPGWDHRLVLDGYGPEAPDAEENVTGIPGVTARVCNISNEAVDDARLAFYIIGLR